MNIVSDIGVLTTKDDFAYFFSKYNIEELTYLLMTAEVFKELSSMGSKESYVSYNVQAQNFENIRPQQIYIGLGFESCLHWFTRVKKNYSKAITSYQVKSQFNLLFTILKHVMMNKIVLCRLFRLTKI